MHRPGQGAGKGPSMPAVGAAEFVLLRRFTPDPCRSEPPQQTASQKTLWNISCSAARTHAHLGANVYFCRNDVAKATKTHLGHVRKGSRWPVGHQDHGMTMQWRGSKLISAGLQSSKCCTEDRRRTLHATWHACMLRAGSERPGGEIRHSSDFHWPMPSSEHALAKLIPSFFEVLWL